MPTTNVHKNSLVSAIVGKSDLPQLSLFLGLSSTTPLVDGTGNTEPTIGVGAYARLPLPSGIWGVATNGVISNTVELSFPTATADWSLNPITHYTIHSHVTDTGFVHFSPIVGTPQNVVANNTIKIAVGDLVVSLTDV
jgi:hypothetical protein